MVCQNCGTEIQAYGKFCPKCGSPVQPIATAQPVATPVQPVATAQPVATPVQPVVASQPVAASVQVMEKPVSYDVSTQGGNSSVDTDNKIKSVWPEWEIEEQIGKGSYGVVYKAIRRDNNVESKAAIKVVSIPTDSSEVDSLRAEGIDFDGTKSYFKNIVDDFVGEIQLMESLKGMQNIVSVEDYKVVEKSDRIGWDIYIRMELLTPFNTYICDRNLTERDVIKLGIDICTALEICGQRNIIHRDIKPENIFVNDFGYFKLGDFGIARKLENMTNGMSQKGTYNYMAPEVMMGKGYDAKVDIYSLGIVLYRLMNGNKLPFLNTDKQVLNPTERKVAIERRLSGEVLPVPCNASPAMASVILRACSFNSNARFNSATEMKNALYAVANGTYTVPVEDKTVSIAHMGGNDMTVAMPKQSPVIPQPANNTPESQVEKKKDKKKKSKPKKGKIIAISILVGILAIAIALTAFFFTSPAYGLYKEMDSEKFERALRTYKREVKDDFIQETILNMLLDGRVEEVGQEYEKGDIDYETAVEELTLLDEMGFDGAKDKIKEITVSNDAENALEKADKYYEDGDYENAISEYSKIPESDENYKEAQEKLEKVYADYISETAQKASAYLSNGDYTEAVKYINTAYNILPGHVNTEALDTLKEKSLASYKTEVANEVTELTSDNKYADAFELINNALAFDDNEFFRELKADTEADYVAVITETVNGHLEKEDYISAKRVVENSLTVLPGNGQLEALKKNVEKQTPIYLIDVVKPYEKTGYTELINGETVTMAGETYTNGFIMTNSRYSDAYAIFNIDSKYSTLSFLLGHVDGYDMNRTVVKIYCDGVLKDEITMDADVLPQKHTIDITGVKQVKIVQYIDSSYSTAYGFVNVTVK